MDPISGFPENADTIPALTLTGHLEYESLSKVPAR